MPPAVRIVDRFQDLSDVDFPTFAAGKFAQWDGAKLVGTDTLVAADGSAGSPSIVFSGNGGKVGFFNNNNSIGLSLEIVGQKYNFASNNLHLKDDGHVVLFGSNFDAGLKRLASAVLALTGGLSGGGALDFAEMAAPSAPEANHVVVYAIDDGSGKTQIKAKFSDGSEVELAAQP